MPDVIVMDMQLPDVPGQEAVEWLRALPGGERTSLITLSWDRLPAAAPTTEMPVLTLSKPVAPRLLRQAINRSLALHDRSSR